MRTEVEVFLNLQRCCNFYSVKHMPQNCIFSKRQMPESQDVPDSGFQSIVNILELVNRALVTAVGLLIMCIITVLLLIL
jgi:hypothetical protein